MTEQHLTLAVLGTGTMGAPMGRNLVAAGHTVRVWNQTLLRAHHGGVDERDPALLGELHQALRGRDADRRHRSTTARSAPRTRS